VDYTTDLLGAVPSPVDTRDYPLTAEVIGPPVGLPHEYLPNPVPPVLQQIGGSCVGFSTTTMRMQQEQAEDGKWLNLDAMWLYNRCKERDGIPNTPGTYVRVAMGVLRSSGQPVIGKGEADHHKIKAYYAIPAKTYDIKQAILALGTIVVAGPWYESWFRPLQAAGWILPTPTKLAGGHAYSIVGWKDTHGFLVQNTWGRDWASTGRAYLPYQYVNRLWEAWKAIDAPTP